MLKQKTLFVFALSLAGLFAWCTPEFLLKPSKSQDIMAASGSVTLSNLSPWNEHLWCLRNATDSAQLCLESQNRQNYKWKCQDATQQHETKKQGFEEFHTLPVYSWERFLLTTTHFLLVHSSLLRHPCVIARNLYIKKISHITTNFQNKCIIKLYNNEKWN